MKQIVHIRKETTEDHSCVVELTERAFNAKTFSDDKEGKLVDKLRKASTFIGQLSLVAQIDGRVVGHILFIPIDIENGIQQFESLAMVSISVFPEFQNMGIGSKLILAGHQKAQDLGFESIIVLGHPEYYLRFGYQSASVWNIKAPFELPEEDLFMAVELTSAALKRTSGTVIYPPEFVLPRINYSVFKCA